MNVTRNIVFNKNNSEKSSKCHNKKPFVRPYTVHYNEVHKIGLNGNYTRKLNKID